MTQSSSHSLAAQRSAELLGETAAPKARFADYLELTKPRLSFLSVITTLVGYLAARPIHDGWRLFHLMAGTALAAGGAAALNMWLEAETDAHMKRTMTRPIPAGKIATGSAFVLGCFLAMGGTLEISLRVNGVAALFAAATVLSYILVYTPSKKWSRWSTEIGAISGALPPLIGWTAAESHVTTLGWILFALLFLWQIPHFMAVAWMYRKDYATVHFPMLPVIDPKGTQVARWSLINALLLVGVTLLPVPLGFCTTYYGCAALVLGAWFLWRAIVFLRPEGREAAARKLFFASIIYLPVLLAALVADRMLF